jgi:hypothetical protein
MKPFNIDRPNPIRMLVLVLAVLLMGSPLLSAEDTANTAPTQTVSLTSDQLDNLVSPVALYPDSLLSQVLVASTYPLQVVQAQQWLLQHADLKGEQLTTAAKNENWDSSVQALVVFPDVLKRLNDDVTWTTNLGNAFLTNQSGVMDAVQRQRQKAEAAGKLKTTEQQKVVNTSEGGQPVVQIEPANPEVIYVPVYDPVWVWGPALYYPYPVWYYPPRPAPDVFFWFGGPVRWSVSFGWGGWWGWGWRPHWHDHNVIINQTFFTRYHYRPSYVWHPSRGPVWVHNNVRRSRVVQPAWRERPAPRDIERRLGEHRYRYQVQPRWDRRNDVHPGDLNRVRPTHVGPTRVEPTRVRPTSVEPSQPSPARNPREGKGVQQRDNTVRDRGNRQGRREGWGGQTRDNGVRDGGSRGWDGRHEGWNGGWRGR